MIESVTDVFDSGITVDVATSESVPLTDADPMLPSAGRTSISRTGTRRSLALTHTEQQPILADDNRPAVELMQVCIRGVCNL